MEYLLEIGSKKLELPKKGVMGALVRSGWKGWYVLNKWADNRWNVVCVGTADTQGRIYLRHLGFTGK